MSNDERLIYVLDFLVFQIVHFRHLVGWKRDFWSFVNWSF